MKKNCNISIYIFILMGLFLFLANSCKDQLSTNSNDLGLKSGKINDKKHSGPDVKDIDGNKYHSVRIGTQVWMVENLNVTHYRNGDPIPNITNSMDWIYSFWSPNPENGWISRTTGAYCNYDNDENNSTIYGRLYNWYAVNDDRNIAPKGWHVASDAEWETLTDYLGGKSIAGTKLKETGTSHWMEPNQDVTNETGFTALPGGYRYGNGEFGTIGGFAGWWTSTQGSEYNSPLNFAWVRELHQYDNIIVKWDYYKGLGFSVRCLRD